MRMATPPNVICYQFGREQAESTNHMDIPDYRPTARLPKDLGMAGEGGRRVRERQCSPFEVRPALGKATYNGDAGVCVVANFDADVCTEANFGGTGGRFGPDLGDQANRWDDPGRRRNRLPTSSRRMRRGKFTDGRQSPATGWLRAMSWRAHPWMNWGGHVLRQQGRRIQWRLRTEYATTGGTFGFASGQCQ